MAGCMEDSIDRYAFIAEVEEHRVRKSPQQRSLIRLVDHRIGSRHSHNRLETGVHTTEELLSQACPALFVPGMGPGEVALDLSRKDQLNGHDDAGCAASLPPRSARSLDAPSDWPCAAPVPASANRGRERLPESQTDRPGGLPRAGASPPD